MSDLKYLVVIGASAGGLKTVSELIAQIDPALDAAYITVLHLSKNSAIDVVVNRIQKSTKMNCHVVREETTPEKGNIYLAPADHHLIISGDSLKLTSGPAENGWRPSIDVLFRSAAVAYNSRVIGIILTGLLDDGTSGMGSIKKCGGITIVQEPAEAEFDAMPMSVIRNVEVDYRVPVSDIAYILQDLASKAMPKKSNVPPEIRIEAEITERMNSSISQLPQIGTHSNYTCPDCGGNLWEIEKDVVKRYRCHTGHVYTRDLLVKKQGEMVEESLWTAIRMMEERRNLLQSSFETVKKNSQEEAETGRLELAQEYEKHIQVLKSLLVTMNSKEMTDPKTA
jgi:two-component system, chemotaxis family, protein-glutamate methylesterase/glutaminase